MLKKYLNMLNDTKKRHFQKKKLLFCCVNVCLLARHVYDKCDSPKMFSSLM